jgi:hypothetical protein
MIFSDFNSLLQDAFITEYLQKNRVLLVPKVDSSLKSILLINLQQLPRQPVNFAEILLRWLVFVNKSRLEKGEEMIITLELLKKCPIWKVIDMPIKALKLDKGSLNKPRGPVPTRKTSKIGSINKKSR